MPNLDLVLSGVYVLSPDQDAGGEPTAAKRWWALLPELRSGDGIRSQRIDPHFAVLQSRPGLLGAHRDRVLAFELGGEAQELVILDGERVDVEPDVAPPPIQARLKGLPSSTRLPTAKTAEDLYWLPSLELVDDRIAGLDRPRVLPAADLPDPNLVAGALDVCGGELFTGSLMGDAAMPEVWEFRDRDGRIVHEQAMASEVIWRLPFESAVKITLTRAETAGAPEGQVTATWLIESKEDLRLDVRNWELERLLGVDQRRGPVAGDVDIDFRAVYDLTTFRPAAADRRTPVLRGRGVGGRRSGCGGGRLDGNG